jgi:hypothetical protein
LNQLEPHSNPSTDSIELSVMLVVSLPVSTPIWMPSRNFLSLEQLFFQTFNFSLIFFKFKVPIASRLKVLNFLKKFSRKKIHFLCLVLESDFWQSAARLPPPQPRRPFWPGSWFEDVAGGCEGALD